jgi:hypothetical protein
MIVTTVAAMSEGAQYEEARRREVAVAKQPPPEPIYDLTKDDETESIKAAGPRERGEEE